MPGTEGKIAFPQNLGELHNLIKNEGVASFYSGRVYPGTEWDGKKYILPDDLISLDKVEELQRISRSETYIDWGSAVSFSALFSKAGHLLPPILMKTAREFYNPGNISSTTPAGIIYSGNIPTSLSLLFNVMEVSYEIRRLRTHRWRGVTTNNHWIYHNQLYKNGRFDLQGGDVVVRLRIPANNWGHIRLRKINLGGKPLYLAMTVDIARNYISNFRFSFALEGSELYRNREGEAHVTGRTISSSSREIMQMSRDTAARIGLDGEEKIVRAIYKCLRNFLYQKSESGA